MRSEFSSWRSYWMFARAVLSERRYIHSAEVSQFLDTVRESSKERITTLKAGTVFFRAQLGSVTEMVAHGDPEDGTDYEVEEEFPYDAKRMKPIPGRAFEGRANPKGIPFLYVATSPDTAMAEIRPWVGAEISVGYFKIKRDLKLVDCAGDRSSKIYLSDDEPPPAAREAAVWSDINKAFSRPITPADDHAAYVPTQVLAEVFRSMDFDGIAYRSSVSDGTNVAIFRLDDADMTGSGLFSVKKVSFEFSQSR